MKSEVTQNPKSKGFPKLMIDPSDGVVVLFARHGDGVVVSSGSNSSSTFEVGNAVGDLLMSLFKDFDGTVTLSN